MEHKLESIRLMERVIDKVQVLAHAVELAIRFTHMLPFSGRLQTFAYGTQIVIAAMTMRATPSIPYSTAVRPPPECTALVAVVPPAEADVEPAEVDPEAAEPPAEFVPLIPTQALRPLSTSAAEVALPFVLRQERHYY